MGLGLSCILILTFFMLSTSMMKELEVEKESAVASFMLLCV